MCKMVQVKKEPIFIKKFSKIKDKNLRDSMIKQIEKIILNPEIGKPMKYQRKGTRELYIKPHRLVYVYMKIDDVIIFLDIYHKDKQ